MAKKPHYTGSYHVQSRRIRDAANADPTTRCWRCRRTMAEIRARKPRARWTAGHLIDGMKDGPLAPECSPCNYAAGARLTHQKRKTHKRTQLTW